MAKDGTARLRLRPVGAADRKKLPEYGPLGTGCPAVERAVAALYKGQNEESFWALMNAINYALELDTRVLVPLEASSDQPDGSATLDCSLLNGLLHAGHDTSEPGEEELRAGNRAMAEGRWDDAMHFYQLSAEEGCAEGLAMMGELLYEGKGCRKSPAQARKFWKKAADAGDVAAWVALGDDAMVQGKGVGAALRAYRKAQKLCASTPDIAYMPQVCLRVAQYETQYISRRQALAQLAEAKQGFLIRQKEGDETARSWLDETERVIRQLLENESG